jgi:hypothetical protein
MADLTSPDVIQTSTNYDTNGTTNGTAGSSIDPTSARLASAGLTSGAVSPFAAQSGQLGSIQFNSSNSAQDNGDWRVRINVSPAVAGYLNISNSPILQPLTGTNGIIFPYTPSITVTHNARYGSVPLTHSNYNSYFYEGSDIQALNIQGDFTAQNIIEGNYVAAVIHFFRTVTKMFFGTDQLAGTPPPIVYLNGYGEAGYPGTYFPGVPCVITNFTHTMPNEVDYILTSLATRVPITSTINLVLQPVYSRNAVSTFNLGDFASGALLGRGFI